MLAHRRRDAADLNLRARRHLRIAGRLGYEEPDPPPAGSRRVTC